ncbi:hypothetical protein NEFER03_0463 [Nematocida sp. LUAm3]|nr:hypothetical protein NEFER03_0463 [Nematocida sp. LUAm3]KAI5175920.1 hypothetical protein NEFER02_1780 [Nematocida sp. LUAm2]KAI5178698.1 hypothetical protein NEFER01_1817 [Nematocida sp. LUAm1]
MTSNILNEKETEEKKISNIYRKKEDKIDKKQWIKERTAVISLGILLYLMDALTIGRKALLANGSIVPFYESISVIFFVLAILLGQIVFYCFSSFSIGLMTSPISETFFSFNTLSLSLSEKYGLTEDRHLCTLVACLMVSSMLTGLGFFLVYLLKLDRFLKGIPDVLSAGLFFVIGCFCILFANETIRKISTKQVYVYIFNIFAVIGWFTCGYLKKKLPSIASYIYVLYLIGMVLCVYSYMYVAGWTMEDLQNAQILSSPPKEFLKGPSWASKCSLSSIDFFVIFKNLHVLAGISLINMIHLPINTTAIYKGTQNPFTLSKELLVNGVSNCCSVVCGGLPIYVLSSSTIALNASIKTKKIDTLLLGVGFCLFYFIFRRFFFYIPSLCFDILLFFIGLDIFVPSAYDIWEMGWFGMAVTAGMAVFALGMDSLQLGVAAGIIIFAFRAIVQRIHAHKKRDSTEPRIEVVSVPLNK